MPVKKEYIYIVFKYLVYAALGYNVIAFLLESMSTAGVIYDGTPTLSQIILAYTDPIDTAAWFVLLLTLELETCIIDDEKLRGPLYWGMNAINTVCYVIIVYSFWGYLGTLLDVPMTFTAFAGDACAAVGGDAQLLLALDEYTPLTPENCTQIVGPAYFSAPLNMYANQEALNATNLLAWVDVINSATWIIVVGVIQLEVYLQSSKLYGTRFFTIYKSSKIGLYVVLFGACLIWWSESSWLDGWDATLWLVAFFFIELNIFTWQEEVAHKRDDVPPLGEHA